MMPSNALRKCKTYGCTYYEYSPGSEKCLSCLKGIKTGPFGSGGGAGAGAATSPPAQSSFQSMFSPAVDLTAKGLRPLVPPAEINALFAWLTVADVESRAAVGPLAPPLPFGPGASGAAG